MKRPLSFALQTFLCATLLAFVRPAPARPGDPDIQFGYSFSNPGTLVQPFPDSSWPVATLAVQADGKILAAGAFGYHSYLGRLTEDGTPDIAFGTGGLVKTTNSFPGEGGTSVIFKTLVQPDGKILLGGAVGELRNYTAQLQVIRHLPDGTRDGFFNYGGVITLGIAGRWLSGSDLALQSDGKILVLGHMFGPNAQNNTLLYRLLPGGGADAGFGTAGLAQFAGLRAQRVAVQPDGKILLGGTLSVNDRTSLQFVRFDEAGQLDASFGNGGILTDSNPLGMELRLGDMGLQGDGKILVAGTAAVLSPFDFRFMLSRFLPDGILDASLNGTGRVITDVTPILDPENNSDSVSALAIQSDGKILVAGRGNKFFKIIRHLPDGSPDPGFGIGGIASTAAGGIPLAMALQPDGKIITGGGNVDTGPVRIARNLARTQMPDFNVEWPAGSPLAFGNTIEMGSAVRNSLQTLEETIILRNSGDAPVTGFTAALVGPGAQRFSLVAPLPPVIDGHSSIPLTVRFTPGTAASASTFTSLLTVTPGDPQFDGLAFPVRAATVEPVAALALFDGASPLPSGATIDFGNGVPGVAITRTLTAKNAGNIDLLLQGNSLGETGTPGDFTAGAPLADVLPPGASTTFPVTFALSGPGVRTATLRVASTDTLNPPHLVRLQGSMPPGREAWRTAWFGTPVNEGAGADLSDPDGDGLSNLIEYAFGLSPLERTSNALPEFKYGRLTYTSILTATFTPPPWAQDILYYVESSPNMRPGSWWRIDNSGTGTTQVFVTSPSGDKSVFVRFVVKVK